MARSISRCSVSVEVSGLEPPDVADKLQKLLKERDLLRDPHVSVYVEQYASKRVSVVGAVANPGTFKLEPGMTVVQAISMAGGFSSLADRDATTVNTARRRTDVCATGCRSGKSRRVKRKTSRSPQGTSSWCPNDCSSSSQAPVE